MPSGTTAAVDARAPTSHPLPLVDVVAYARTVHVRSGHGRSDLITTATIYGAAALATGGFIVAAIVDEVLRRLEPSRRQPRGAAPGRR